MPFRLLFILLCAGLTLGFFDLGRQYTHHAWRKATNDQVMPTRITWKHWMAVTFGAIIYAAVMTWISSIYDENVIRGTPRSIEQLKNGEYRTVYRTPDGTEALIAPINGGEPTYYRLEQKFLGEGEYCFRRSRPDYQPVYTLITCPPIQSP